jgi:small nuclear ribonucleoprotein (snRNP)-like protein
MNIKECKGMNVCIELKNGSKYFGKLIDIDESPKIFHWYILKKNSKTQLFCNTEIARIELLEDFE